MEKNDQNIWKLIAGKLHNELDQSEQEVFEQKLQDPANQSLYNRSAQIFQGMKQAASLQNADKERSWAVIEKRIRVDQVKQVAFRIFKYAAILVLAFASGLYFHSMYKPGARISYAEIEVTYGQMGHLYLFDGTEVWLNSGSKFRYPNQFNQNERNVFLEGEAFFKVAHNEKLPFKVHTEKIEVEVLGTSFNISAYPDEAEQTVVLEEGKVQLNTPGGKKMGEILPGEIAVKTNDKPGLTVRKADSYTYTCWKDGKITFQEERLGDIAEKLERWYNVEIRFEKEKLRDLRFSGTILRNKPIDQSLLTLELLAPIQFKYEVKISEKNVIVISEKQ